eukprot:CAMPEP_0172538246 /NCGR_PEP_ID=MMETSP1067-20121228/9673_1 /TAXON_ID=265564 ORGANISM="Thalassiosira punctigera, Strain Tpunct2005C2" /NCGR_SAMPLE_ID=MMETSP1067 /ASSEMBLY_ACC=CAM_ASM_000444 /LENGTH=111 /DNA_ID=CAMNT_0013323703 /DNA_START=356 /DNA_END=692 /DNA_ORIENTATION=-
MMLRFLAAANTVDAAALPAAACFFQQQGHLITVVPVLLVDVFHFRRGLLLLVASGTAAVARGAHVGGHGDVVAVIIEVPRLVLLLIFVSAASAMVAATDAVSSLEEFSMAK